ncbi:helix-turn-helix transcriptional regulator [Kitasatospora sp. NBC_00240]|uniref:helix-turn-helix transcriptional regulator n=1 Tax=Kitasatospora sp. NBC_00240 TaxID=2903567 RepID=UPI0022526090|nr:helix-turn-helix transcriptional regulator [Kitasatospora sp. NBC_00240]MCX5213611.1 helix-turn-helix transcriptional regulator [Kitasatospora sp. NBC_00240]
MKTAGTARRTALSNFLRSRRARLTPEDVGMAPGLRRRTPGLRREELAVLAGVGVTWYTWLEQGRAINPSPEVLASLARTLRLDQAETEYLFRLAGSHALPAEGPVPERVPGALLRLLQAQSPSPAFLVDSDWDVRAWNPQADALFEFSGRPAGECNLGWVVFANHAHRARTVDWERHARRTLAQLRAAYGERGGDGSPGARRLAALIARLRAGFPEADRWLDEHQVQERSGTEKDLVHEVLGPLRIDQLVLRAQGEPQLELVVFAPRDEETAERLRRLVPDGEPASDGEQVADRKSGAVREPVYGPAEG